MKAARYNEDKEFKQSDLLRPTHLEEIHRFLHLEQPHCKTHGGDLAKAANIQVT